MIDEMTTPLRLTIAVVEDVPMLHALVESAYRGASAQNGWTHEADLIDGQRTDSAALREILADPQQLILLAWRGDRLTGCVQLSNNGNGLCYMGMLSVTPTMQTHGLGRLLIAEAEARAIGQFGATRIEMTVVRQRVELIAWYQRRGYALTGETRAFPYDDVRFGVPKRPDLSFVVLERALRQV